MSIKVNTQFLLDKEKGKDDAKLRYRIKWNDNKSIVAFNVGYRVDIAKWSLETQRCVNNTTHGKKKVQANVINKEIQRFEQIAEQAFNSFGIAGHIPSEDELRKEFNRLNGKIQAETKDEKSFFAVFDEFTKTMGFMNSWTDETYVKFASIRKHLNDFDSELSFEKLSDYTLQLYTQHLLQIPLRNTTISKNLAFVRWFLRWAHNNGYYSGFLHETYKPRLKGVDGNSKEVIHLTWEELLHLYNLNIDKPAHQHLARVRDVFCFCCFTSLRYSDVEKLRRSDIKGNTIVVVTKKTVDGLTIDLNKYSRAILDKYADFHFEDDKALPVISNSNMNDYLKALGKLAGFEEPQRIVYFIGNERHEEVYPKYELLTTHCGRRTFIVNALYLGIPAEVVMKWTGHSDYKAMKPYIKIVDKLKVQEMDKFNRD